MQRTVSKLIRAVQQRGPCLLQQSIHCIHGPGGRRIVERCALLPVTGRWVFAQQQQRAQCKVRPDLLTVHATPGRRVCESHPSHETIDVHTHI